mmetsp:Transcript_12130/g.18108  ORF Transcript_12130/g.18108 Transcript_12130/m.18108 type:complete len:118 (+) Transcript_12130:54-407(+)
MGNRPTLRFNPDKPYADLTEEVKTVRKRLPYLSPRRFERILWAGRVNEFLKGKSMKRLAILTTTAVYSVDLLDLVSGEKVMLLRDVTRVITSSTEDQIIILSRRAIFLFSTPLKNEV